MTDQDMPMPGAEPVRMQRRVVETEIRLPHFSELGLPKVEELGLPKVDLKPVRDVAGEVLITGLGIGVLVVRGVMAAVKAAYDAGKNEVENPSPVTKKVIDLMRREGKTSGQQIRITVPVLPVDDYDSLSVADLLVRLPDLREEQLRVLREYEFGHQNRAEVIEAYDQRLGVS